MDNQTRATKRQPTDVGIQVTVVSFGVMPPPSIWLLG
jgi:hypothetical protein